MKVISMQDKAVTWLNKSGGDKKTDFILPTNARWIPDVSVAFQYYQMRHS